MMNRNILIFGFIAILFFPASAQRAKQKAPIRKKAVAESPVTEENPRLAMMRQATQRIMFIDSVIVDKQGFLQSYYLSSESGTLITYADFFHEDGQPYSIVNLNELGNKAYFSKSGRLYTVDLLGDKHWSSAIPLSGFDGGGYLPANYPFMMADGVTLYFAAAGSESIGGLDIFVTRYDSNSGSFLQPENIGMPFNSEANDYMLAIDEMNNIGYFATDRRQPEGKVCIYTFVPNQTRRIYDVDVTDEQKLLSYAEIRCIADTWTDKKVHDQAAAQLAYLRTQKVVSGMTKANHDKISFYINDNTTYHDINEFKVWDNRARYRELNQSISQLRQLESDLDQLRKQFISATTDDRSALTDEILAAENRFNTLQAAIQQLEKSIRNTEIEARSPLINP